MSGRMARRVHHLQRPDRVALVQQFVDRDRRVAWEVEPEAELERDQPKGLVRDDRHRLRAALAGDGVATWPNLCAGWNVFNLNHVQHKATLARLATLEPRTVGVGHGDPITENAAEQVQQLAESY